MEHPSRGRETNGHTGSSPFHRCRPGRRCNVCRLLEAQDRREGALFTLIVGADDEVARRLEVLAGLFYDADVAAPGIVAPGEGEHRLAS